MIKIIDINFLNQKAAVGCFLIKDGKDFVLIETGPSLYYEEIKKSLNKINVDINKIKNVLCTNFFNTLKNLSKKQSFCKLSIFHTHILHHILI